MRVTIIDSQGTVVGDSALDRTALRELRSHRGRPEVLAAQRNGQGLAGVPGLSEAAPLPLGIRDEPSLLEANAETGRLTVRLELGGGRMPAVEVDRVYDPIER